MTFSARLFPAWAAVAALFLALGTAHRAAGQSGHVKVEVEGVRGALADNVRAMLQIAREGKGKLPPDRVERLHRKAEADIQTALEPYGYYHARVTKSLQRDGDNWIARYVIDPGAVVKVRSVQIEIAGEGERAPAFRQMVDTFPLKRGDTLLQAKYTAAKLNFIALASDSGYLKADYDSAAILLDRTADTARIYLRYDTGPRATFGPVRFHESRDIIDTTFLATRISFKQGESFRHDKLLDLQASLSEDPYWARVEVTPKPDEMAGRAVPIDVDLVPNPRFATEEGLGYGTDTGPRLHAQGSIRWINRRGHNADATLELGTIKQSIQLAYRIPAFGSPTGILQFEAGYERDHPSTSLTHDGKVRTSLLRKRFGWQETLSLTYQHQTYGVGVDSGTSKLLTPGISYTRTHADSKSFPLHGYKAQVDAQGSHQGLLANASFLQLHALAKGITSVGKRTRLLARVEAGHDFTSQFRILPPTLRFFTGGDQTVRGFGYQTVGGLDELGDVIGGSTLAVASIEGEYRVFERYGVAVFSDVGSAANTFSLRGLEQGVGAGLRWLSPVGMVRLDGAFAISRPGAPFRIHLSIGADL